MTKQVLSVLIFLSSASFFNGCSTTTPHVKQKLAKKSVSVYNIMGIKAPSKKHQPLFIVKDDTNTNYSFITTNYTPPPHQPLIPASSASVIDSSTLEYSYSEPISPPSTIEVVSYGSYNRPPQNRYINSYELIDNIESNAKSFLGTKYVWGATGPTQFDCSGFTQWVYRDAGINIPRVSRDQAKVGEYVSYENLRRGDMVFFDTKKHKKGIVTHVGIYLGNGNFIHASSAAKKVVVYNFNEKPFYKKRFLWGRRVVHENQMYASN